MGRCQHCGLDESECRCCMFCGNHFLYCTCESYPTREWFSRNEAWDDREDDIESGIPADDYRDEEW